MKMSAVKARITRCLDDTNYPSFVECIFADARGLAQRFHDKDAVFTGETLDRNSVFPVDGIVGCQIVERKLENGIEIVKVDTKLPWHIESTAGETVFEVRADQLIEFEHQEK